MRLRMFAALFGAMALYASAPSLAQGNGQGGDNDDQGGKVAAPQLDGPTAALGLALAASAIAALNGRFRRNGQ